MAKSLLHIWSSGLDRIEWVSNLRTQWVDSPCVSSESMHWNYEFVALFLTMLNSLRLWPLGP